MAGIVEKLARLTVCGFQCAEHCRWNNDEQFCDAHHDHEFARAAIAAVLEDMRERYASRPLIPDTIVAYARENGIELP
jgi:hypothetical protein